MNERLKKLREILGMTQQEIADKIGIKRNTYSQYETGRNAPVDAVFSLICRTFNVSPTWLKTGEGEIFVDMQENRKAHLKRLIDERIPDENEEFRTALLEAIISLDKEALTAVKEYAVKYLLPSLQEQEAAGGSGTQKEILTAKEELEIAREVEDYRAQLRAEKIAAARSEASSTTEERREA